MAKIKNPVLFSTYFDINASKLESCDVLNPTLNVDTKLFIDPLLIGASKHKEIRRDANRRLRKYFESMIKILKASRCPGDTPWRQASRILNFREIEATCLGYGAASIHGRAFGVVLKSRLLRTAKEIIDLGCEDPELFLLLPLLEEGIGPDRISDMVTNIILPELAQLTERIVRKFKLKSWDFKINNQIFRLPRNPYEIKLRPIILVPKDILRELPIALDWEGVCDAASRNAQIREEVSKYIGAIWEAKTRRQKAEIRRQVLSSREAVETLLATLGLVEPIAYDFARDPSGVVVWRKVRERIATDYPLSLLKEDPLDLEKVFAVAKKIVEQFKFLIEERGLADILWFKNKPRHENVAQMIFFAVADSYCKANQLDITPEADTGTGIVDFKFSSGYDSRVLVEVKLSKNSKLVAGYETQLEIYKGSERTARAIYLVIDVGKMGKKDKALLDVKNKIASKGEPVSDIVFVDGAIKLSASKQ